MTFDANKYFRRLQTAFFESEEGQEMLKIFSNTYEDEMTDEEIRALHEAYMEAFSRWLMHGDKNLN